LIGKYLRRGAMVGGLVEASGSLLESR
jgi:hypothetical protein